MKKMKVLSYFQGSILPVILLCTSLLTGLSPLLGQESDSLEGREH